MENISMHGTGGVKLVTMNVKNGDALTSGMAVTLTGPNEVGLGAAAGSAVFGVVERIQANLAAVQVAGFNDQVKMAATTANQPAFGTLAVCNNKGELVKVADMSTVAGVSRGAVVTAVDTTAVTATVMI